MTYFYNFVNRFGGKEAYMQGLNEFVERELPNMKKFLESISVIIEIL